MTEKQTGNARSVFRIMDERSLHCSILRGGYTHCSRTQFSIIVRYSFNDTPVIVE